MTLSREQRRKFNQDQEKIMSIFEIGRVSEETHGPDGDRTETITTLKF